MKHIERRILKLFSSLRDSDKETLLAFAEFLAARCPDVDPSRLREPKHLPRPKQETVIKAIKRLSASYPMLDRAKMLNETSSFVTQHVLQGRSAPEVIDDLEAMFRQQYERFKKEMSGADVRKPGDCDKP